MRAAGRARSKQLAGSGYHVDVDEAFGRHPEHAGSMADRILRHGPADGRRQPGERTPEWRPKAARRERFVQLRPAAAGLDGDGRVGLVDVDAVEAAGVDGDAAG